MGERVYSWNDNIPAPPSSSRRSAPSDSAGDASAPQRLPCRFCRSIGTPQHFESEEELKSHVEQEHGLRYENPAPVAAEAVVVGIEGDHRGSSTDTPELPHPTAEISVEASIVNDDEIIPLAQSTILLDECQQVDEGGFAEAKFHDEG